MQKSLPRRTVERVVLLPRLAISAVLYQHVVLLPRWALRSFGPPRTWSSQGTWLRESCFTDGVQTIRMSSQLDRKTETVPGG